MENLNYIVNVARYAGPLAEDLMRAHYRQWMAMDHLVYAALISLAEMPHVRRDKNIRRAIADMVFHSGNTLAERRRAELWLGKNGPVPTAVASIARKTRRAGGRRMASAL